MQKCVRSSVEELERRLEGVLAGVADDLAVEVGREQQHLMLMQDQVPPLLAPPPPPPRPPRGGAFWLMVAK